MRLRYDGPAGVIIVAPYGPHPRGMIIDYPDDVAAELLATSRRNRFRAIGTDPDQVKADMSASKPVKRGKRG